LFLPLFVKKLYPLFLILLLLTVGCAYSQDCVDGINKLPMYGHIKKCNEQLDDDAKFLAYCDKLGSRKELSAHMLMRGWQYLYKNQLDTSMMRFNQAWLLDSLNAEIYWGFGDNLGMQRKFRESLPFFERSLKMNPNNAKVWGDASNSYGNAFYETKDEKYLKEAINALKCAIHLDPNNAGYYGQITSAYCYFTQKDSARKYLKIADRLNPNVVRPEERAMINVK